MTSFITDLGENLECRGEDGTVAMTLPRYGVWVYDAGKGKPQVVESSDNLEYLRTKYGVPGNRVVQLEGEEPGSGPAL